MLSIRPDLSYTLGAVSQFSSAPSIDYLAALHHILRYILGFGPLQLHLTRCSVTLMATPLTQPHGPKMVWDTNIAGYSNCDWAGYLDSCHCTSA